MRVLLLGDAERARLAELVSRAATSPTDHATMVKIAEASRQGRDTAALNRALTVDIPDGYTVTLTYEEHKPGVMCRHASVGVRAEPGKGPNPEAVAELLTVLGFKNGLGKMPMWTEPLADGTFAVNAVEPLSGDTEELRR